MGGIVAISDGTRVARKHHKCFDCYRPIAPRERHAFQTNVCDGSVYTIRQHIDCRDLADQYRNDNGLSFWDYNNGFPPLHDEWSESGEFETLCDAYRGHFPHPVCRMEWRKQIAEIRRSERLAALSETLK